MKVFTNSQGKVYMANSKALSNYTGKYNLLDRIKDDSGNEIGTVSGFFTDANDNEYAVVCLDAKDRNNNGTWCSNATTAVTDLPFMSNALTSAWYHTTNTATYNTQKILDFCVANNYTSSACTHCRSKSYVIDGVTYYGQLPNLREVYDIQFNLANINNKDTTASSYSARNFEAPRSFIVSEQYDDIRMMYSGSNGTFSATPKDSTGVKFVCPVLEIPN